MNRVNGMFQNDGVVDNNLKLRSLDESTFDNSSVVEGSPYFFVKES